MTTTGPLDDIRKIGDPLERLGKLAVVLAEAERRATELRKLRDETIRQARAASHSIPKIAEAAGVSDTTVKSVLR